MNLDFEALLGKDRAAYTAFVQKFADGAHARGLTLSIDLPRGSVKWNHLARTTTRNWPISPII